MTDTIENLILRKLNAIENTLHDLKNEHHEMRLALGNLAMNVSNIEFKTQQYRRTSKQNRT